MKPLAIPPFLMANQRPPHWEQPENLARIRFTCPHGHVADIDHAAISASGDVAGVFHCKAGGCDFRGLLHISRWEGAK